MIAASFPPPAIEGFLAGQRHATLERAVALAGELAVHAAGTDASALLNSARPNEAPIYKEYRKSVYEPVTKPDFDKIHAQAAKLRRAQGLTLALPDRPLSPSVLKTRTPGDYLTKDLPGHDHLFTWLFTYATRKLLADPNALCVVLPREGLSLPAPVSQTEQYLTPTPTIYPAVDVLDFVPDAYAVVVLARNVTYTTAGGGTATDGVRLLLLDADEFAIVTQTGARSPEGRIPYALTTTAHGTALLPAVLLGSTMPEVERDGRIVYASFLSPCLPHWNEAVRRYSDHQVNMALHLHPEKVMKMTTACKAKDCQGGRLVRVDPDAGRVESACGACHGTGYISVTSPFGVHYVAPESKGGMGAVSVPAGELISYVQKPTNDLAFLKQEYRDKLTDALDAVGLGYLAAVPLNQSGRAKELDRSEINTFYAAIATHLIDSVLKPVIWYILQQRYSFVAEAERTAWYDAMTITVPDSFDVVGLDYYRARVRDARDSGEPALLAAEAAIEYAEKEYGPDALATRLLRAQLALDPLPGLSATEKTDIALAEGCSRLDVRVSVGLPALLRRALETAPGLLTASLAVQRAAVYALATADATATAPVPLAPEPVAPPAPVAP